jgi:AraC-like DNA-binding protein/mannose-6-phosphate isomerase-like protein (cupin superfamily)
METLFSTNDVHPRDRFDYWHEVACRNYGSHDSQAEHRLKFNGVLQAGALADIGLTLVEHSPLSFARTPRHIAHATDDHLFVCRQLAGALALEQNGREVVLEAGDVVLIDPLLPYVGRVCSDVNTNSLVLKVPRRALEARIGRTGEMVARSLKSGGAEASLTSSFLAMSPSYAGRMRPAAEDIVKEQVLDLIAVSLTNVMGTHRPRLSSAHSLALMNVRAAIETRLTDPALDAAAVAAAAGIGVRYANAVLAREGTSIMRLIQARRLERCRRVLEDPLQAHRTLSEIAYGWGFSDMTHFSRRFKAAYGVLPSEYRGLVKEAGQATILPERSGPKASPT